MWPFKKLHEGMKLGKGPAKHDSRTLLFARYSAALAPAPLALAPNAYGLSAKLTALGMMMNDSLGDCTAASMGHTIQTWTAIAGSQVVIPDDDVLGFYEASCGYNPSDPSTDQGGIILDVLNYWRKNPVAGHALDAYADIDLENVEELKQAVYYFGVAYCGVLLPLSAQNQDVWDVPAYGLHFGGVPNSWGGHCVPIVDYNTIGPVCITWGQLKQMTWKFYSAYFDEAKVLFGADWCATGGKCPTGFDYASLQSDVTRIAA